ncbi:MAG: hypothetical protein M3Y65_24330 [Pseudomonadota bacterium]|nr:hypothetical protein [Pseudomonadota bacterium]
MRGTLLLLLILMAGAARADDIFTSIDAAPRSELWIDSGFATAHFNSGKNLNGANVGYGAEYRFSGTMAAAAGHFYNSDRSHSSYGGVIWQPYAIGPLRLGATVAAFNGYPRVRDGRWFPALIPTMTLEYKRVGVNIGVIPSLGDRLYGGVSVQLKLKIFE